MICNRPTPRIALLFSLSLPVAVIYFIFEYHRVPIFAIVAFHASSDRCRFALALKQINTLLAVLRRLFSRKKAISTNRNGIPNVANNNAPVEFVKLPLRMRVTFEAVFTIKLYLLSFRVLRLGSSFDSEIARTVTWDSLKIRLVNRY